MVLLKLWNSDKSTGYLISPSKFEDLCVKAKEKFHLEQESLCKFVLEDGIQIDTDGFSSLVDNTVVYMLQNGQELNLPSTSTTRTEQAKKPTNLLELVKRVREKQTNLYQRSSKKRKLNLKINIGWFVWNGADGKYVQVKLRTGGGSRELDVPGETNYTSLLEMGKDLFFPYGICETRGHVTSYSHVLGDFRQNIITQEDFTVTGYASKYKLSTRPRLYLMSKKKTELDMDEDMELPDLDVDTFNIADSPDIPEVTLIDSDLEEDRAADVANENVVSANNRQESTEQNSTSTAAEANAVAVDHSYGSPTVTINWPRIPVCTICTDRYSDSYLQDCGHICCMVCAVELEERGSICHVCRTHFTQIRKLYY